MTVRIFDRVTGAIIGALALALIAVLAGLVDAGPLDPAGPPGPTLPQVEPRNPIPPVGWNGTFPIVISQPGSYFLTRNLEPIGAPAGISINASYVTLDLNGFDLDGGTVVGTGIDITANQFGIEVKNGTVRRFTVTGIQGAGATGARYRDLRLENNGLAIALVGSSVLEDCTVRGGTNGVVIAVGTGTTVRNCTFAGQQGSAIEGGGGVLIEGNSFVVPNNSTGISVSARSTVRSNVIVGETSTYISVYLEASVKSVLVQNRIECGTAAGNAADDSFVFDAAHEATNFCHNP